MITLYGMSSPNVRKILIALEEMALDYDLVHVSVFRGRQFEPEFIDLNPMAKVPVIVDENGAAEGVPIFESGAILLYLAENYGREFIPAGGPGRYTVLKWLFMQVANVGPALGNHGHFRMFADDNDYAADRFRRMTAQVFRVLDSRLAEAPYLGGENYSIADMATHPWARRVRHFGWPVDECPHLLRWVERIAARPAVRAADSEIRRLGEIDSRDIAEASDEEMAMFTGRHIVAPAAEAAATPPPWWRGRR